MIGRMPRSVAGDLSALPLRLVFAKNLRAARIEAGLSQEALAAEAGLDRTFVGTLERGQRNISVDNIEALSKAIRIAAHELMNPRFAVERGLDVSLARVPGRSVRPYSLTRRR
jgi:transcriptional regulator with XRE-family HTH domain